MNAVLSDVLVLDLSRVLAGPYCTMMLGDLGATVIKIERPDGGDDTRGFGPPYVGGESTYYLGLNRNKYSVTLDFNTPADKEQLLKLARKATVLVENFRPGTLAHKGLGYEDLHALNPGLIYCSISGFGQTGPKASYPGYDFIAQAMSGLMAITGEVNGPPMPVGTPVSDVTAGTYAFMSILAALRVRDRTGQGQQIDISLFEAATSLLANVASAYLMTGQEAHRYGNGHPSIVPYQVFRARNGNIAIACGNDHLYDTLCHVLGRDDLINDERFATNAERTQHRDELTAILQSLLLEHSVEEWLTILHQTGIPCGPINHVSDAFKDEQHKARHFIWECEHPTAGTIHVLGSPMHLSETPPRLYKAPPLLGEDNDQLKQWQEISAEEKEEPLYERLIAEE